MYTYFAGNSGPIFVVLSLYTHTRQQDALVGLVEFLISRGMGDKFCLFLVFACQGASKTWQVNSALVPEVGRSIMLTCYSELYV
jgi:hypothetical protein